MGKEKIGSGKLIIIREIRGTRGLKQKLELAAKKMGVTSNKLANFILQKALEES
jgi:hypothetical protein